MIDFYYPLLFMSATAAVLYLILKLLSRWTKKFLPQHGITTRMYFCTRYSLFRISNCFPF